MGSPALITGQRAESIGTSLSGATDGTQLTAGAAHAKGSYAELEDSTTFAAAGFYLQSLFVTAGTEWLIDIAIGAGGSEQIIVANHPYSAHNQVTDDSYIPLPIPVGTRIAARVQSESGTASLWVTVMLVAAGALAPGSLARATTYGANTADSGGSSVDPGATANAKGAYTEISPATTAQIRFLILAFGLAGDVVRTSCRWAVDIAIGAGGSEQVVVANRFLACNGAHDGVAPQYFCIALDIPLGLRLAVRAQCTTNVAGDRAFDATIIGGD